MAAQTSKPIPHRGHRSGRFPLRTKLTGSMVLLLTFVCVVIGVSSEFALGAFLTHQTDVQLFNALGRARAFGGPDPAHAPGQGIGTLTGIYAPGETAHGTALSNHGDQALTAAEAAVLQSVPTDGRGHTVTVGDLGGYRVAAEADNQGTVLVVGLPMAQVSSILWQLGLILFVVAAAGIVGAAFLGAYAVRRTLRPLDRVAATASRVSELPLDRGHVALSIRVPEAETDPRTEVGQVGSALNLMLGHVSNALAARHASETRVRQFVADASHELRTPLAAIRGYAELARRGQSLVPPDVARSMTRIESEADRMTVLVEDLLLLARLDTGRPLEVAEVDLTRLVADAVGDAQVAGPGHRWQLDLPPASVYVLGDVQRLHQVLANLLANARTHTPPGTTVRAALTRDADGTAMVTVTDNGPGISPEVLPDVFERFARGDSSRSRAAGSTGLGLAIASAVVVAHHGTIEVSSHPGRTRFAVRLPVAVPAQRRPRDGTAAPKSRDRNADTRVWNADTRD